MSYCRVCGRKAFEQERLTFRSRPDLCGGCDRSPGYCRCEPLELEATFDLRWKADMRAIKRWQEAHPGNELVWPDHADLVVWLMDELDDERQRTSIALEGEWVE